MKTYEKPKLMVLSFTVNDALCGNCAVKTRFDSALSDTLLELVGSDLNNNNIFDQGDIRTGQFGSEDSCEVNVYDGYCVFTATDNKLFTS